MKKLITILMLLCSVVSVWGQDDFGKKLLAEAQAGDAKAQQMVGFDYECGFNGFPKDLTEAFKWYKKSAEQGFAEGQDYLGSCYIYGNGVAKNEEEGLRWLRKAAAQGYSSAMFSLGLYYEDINKDEAIYWFKKNMDAWYAEYGEEYERAAEKLRKLGVYYHPDSNRSTASNSSSSSSRSNQTATKLPIPNGKYFVSQIEIPSADLQFDSDGTVVVSNNTIKINIDGNRFLNNKTITVKSKTNKSEVLGDKKLNHRFDFYTTDSGEIGIYCMPNFNIYSICVELNGIKNLILIVPSN